MNVNYQRELERLLRELEQSGVVPRLLLHTCCAPCGSYVLEYLSRYFDITVYFYNPNISPETEFLKRANELRRLLAVLPAARPVGYVQGPYDGGLFLAAAKGLEDEPEGGERCKRCYALRLREAARLTRELGFDFFATSLTISPMKNTATLNLAGEAAGEAFGVKYLASDFKKREGYKRSLELSREYGLYRQSYCGCLFSKNWKRQK